MEPLVILKNPVLTPGSRTASMIMTLGRMGDKHPKLSRGDSQAVLGPGDTIIETDSALDIEEIIIKYAFGDVWANLNAESFHISPTFI